jgi:glycerol-3-phosphate dehydrogenase
MVAYVILNKVTYLLLEALKESLMAQNAGHLVKNQSFVIPNYNWWGGYFYTLGPYHL